MDGNGTLTSQGSVGSASTGKCFSSRCVREKQDSCNEAWSHENLFPPFLLVPLTRQLVTVRLLTASILVTNICQVGGWGTQRQWRWNKKAKPAGRRGDGEVPSAGQREKGPGEICKGHFQNKASNATNTRNQLFSHQEIECALWDLLSLHRP